MKLAVGAGMGGSENQHHKGRDYREWTKELKSVAAGAAQ